MIQDSYSKIKGAWGFKCKDCGHEYSNGAGGCDACRVCAKCGKSGGCHNRIYELTPMYAFSSGLELFTEAQLKEELERREKIRQEEQQKQWDSCQHEWQYWRDYYSKGRDCKKCGKKE